MDFSLVDHIASIATLVGFPLVIVGLLDLYRERALKMHNWRKWVGMVLLLAGACAYAIDASDRLGWIGGTKLSAPQLAKWPDPYAPISVVGKTYKNEKVILDGISYSGCIFENVTFVYNGTTPIQFTNNSVRGSIQMRTDNPAVGGAIGWLGGFIELPPNVSIDFGPNNRMEVRKQ